MSDAIVQIVMALTGLVALALAYSSNARCRRWGPFIGLAGQVAWLLFAFQARAWGLFTLAVAYTLTFAWHAWRQVRGAH